MDSDVSGTKRLGYEKPEVRNA